jgi:hypothetical protein
VANFSAATPQINMAAFCCSTSGWQPAECEAARARGINDCFSSVQSKGGGGAFAYSLNEAPFLWPRGPTPTFSPLYSGTHAKWPHWWEHRVLAGNRDSKKKIESLISLRPLCLGQMDVAPPFTGHGQLNWEAEGYMQLFHPVTSI